MTNHHRSSRADAPKAQAKPTTVVVGDGIVGTCLVLGLLQAGQPVTWVVKPNKPDALRQRLQVSAINHHSQALFRDLGVWSSLLNHAHPYRRMEVTWEQERLCFSHRDVGTADIGHIVAHAAIEEALTEAVAAYSGMTRCVCEHELRVDDHGNVVVDDQAIATGLLLAADGRRSPIRACLGVGAASRDYGQSAWVVAAQSSAEAASEAWQHFLPTGPLAWLPRGEGHGICVWSLNQAQALTYRQDPAAMAADLRRHLHPLLDEIVVMEERLCFPLWAHHADRYVAGRAVLMGDAAHGIHPLAGMGLNLGLADVAALLPIVAVRAEIDWDSSAGQGWLRRYERRRRWHNAAVYRAMTMLWRFHGDVSDGLIDQSRASFVACGWRTVASQSWLRRALMHLALGEALR